MSENDRNPWAGLCELVSSQMQQLKIPGVALGVLHQGRMQTAGFGVTNADHPLPVTDETLFQIGSITKTYTGTAIMRLVEQGKIDLGATVRTYLPEFKVIDQTASSQATVRHLLTHMGGWAGDYFSDTGAGEDALVRYVVEMAELPQLAPLASVWSYNNAGFIVAGRIIEVVTGQKFEQALSELVLEPLGLEHSYFDPGDLMTYRFAVGHFVQNDAAMVARPWPLPRSAYAAGGIACHVKDLLAYARFHLGDGTSADGVRLLKGISLTEMQTPQVTVWKDEKWGLTWKISDDLGTRRLFHGGGTTGQISLLMLAPEHDFALAVLTNADRGSQLIDKARRWATRRYLNVDDPVPQPMPAKEAVLAELAGRYSRPMMDVEVGLLGGRLVAALTYKMGFPDKDIPPPPAPPPMTLALCEPDRLVAMDGPAKDALLEIIRKPDGSIGWLRFGRIHPRLEEGDA